VLAGLVERVTFHNAENGFCVLRTKARGHRDLVTVVGHAATIAAGEWTTALGEWVNDRIHGQQFKAHFLHTSAPSTVNGIRKYLASGMMPRHRPGVRQEAGVNFRRQSIRCYGGATRPPAKPIERSLRDPVEECRPGDEFIASLGMVPKNIKHPLFPRALRANHPFSTNGWEDYYYVKTWHEIRFALNKPFENIV
jgi:hypothetical protein